MLVRDGVDFGAPATFRSPVFSSSCQLRHNYSGSAVFLKTMITIEKTEEEGEWREGETVEEGSHF